MFVHTMETPAAQEADRAIAVGSAFKERRSKRSNIWFFESPKNDQRLMIETDLAFMHLVLLEGDQSVQRYEPILRGEYGLNAAAGASARIYRSDGMSEWWHFKRLETRAGRPMAPSSQDDCHPIALAASDVGASYQVKTDKDLRDKAVLFDNWLMLCAAINRCRQHHLEKEVSLLHQRLQVQDRVTLANLLNMSGADQAYMLAVVALALRDGIIQANLTTQLLSLASFIERGQS